MDSVLATAAMRREALSRSLRGYEGAIADAYAPLKIAPGTPRGSYAWRVEGARCGALGFTHIYARGSIQGRIPSDRRSDAQGNYVLTYVQDGAFEFEQDGRHAACGAGTLVLMDATRPLLAGQHALADLLSIVIPASLLTHRIPSADALCTCPLSVRDGAAALLRDFMLSSWRERAWFAQASSTVVPGIVIDLLQASFGRLRAASPRAAIRASEHWQSLCALVEREVRNPDLTPDFIARELGLSRSRLFALTRQFGTSVRRLIIDTRLDACRAALDDAAWAHSTITDLAIAFGFQDLAHFSRRFTARFGMSPRASRGACVREPTAVRRAP